MLESPERPVEPACVSFKAEIAQFHEKVVTMGGGFPEEEQQTGPEKILRLTAVDIERDF